MFASIGGRFGDGPLNAANRIFARRFPLPWQSYNSACVREICEIFAFIVGIRDGSMNAANRIFSQPTPVAMATKFRTMLAINRSV